MLNEQEREHINIYWTVLLAQSLLDCAGAVSVCLIVLLTPPTPLLIMCTVKLVADVRTALHATGER